MHIYRELTDPTVSTHSLTIDLEGRKSSTNLVVVKGCSLLQVFRVLKTSHSDMGDSKYELIDEQLPTSENQDTFAGTELPVERVRTRNSLKLLAQFPLNGTVVQLSKIHRLDRARPSILVVFKYAKMVVLEWNPSTLKLVPLSLHYYEKELEQSHFRNNAYIPKLAVDPSSLTQCAAIMFQKDTLAMISFPSNVEDENVQAFNPSIILNTVDLDPACQNVVDLAFLHDFKDPTLALLFQQPERTWAGDIALRKDTSSFMAISIDIQGRRSTPITSLQGLPFDLNQVVTLSNPIRGALLIGSNTIVYVHPSGNILAAGVNKFAAVTTSLSLTDYSNLNVDLNGCKAIQIPNTKHVAISLSDGQLLELAFQVEGSKVLAFSLEKVKTFPVPCDPTSISVSDSWLFIGSANANAALVGWKLAKRAVGQTESDAHDITVDEVDDLYNEMQLDSVSVDELQFNLDDELVSVGPISSITSIDIEDDDETSTVLAAATGAGVSGGVAIIQKTVAPLIRDRFTLHRKSRSAEVFSKIWCIGSYIVASDTNSSVLYKGPNYNSVKSKEFVSDHCTLDMAMISGNRSLQIYSGGAALYSSDFSKSQLLELGDVRAAQISGDYALLDTDGELVLYAAEASKTGQNAMRKVSKLPVYGTQFSFLGDMIVVALEGRVAVLTVGNIDVVQWYDFTLLDDVVDHEHRTEASEELRADISQILLSKLGDSIRKSTVLSVVVGDIMATYALVYHDEANPTPTFIKENSMPMFSEKELINMDNGSYSTIVVAGKNSSILMKGEKSPIRVHPFNIRPVRSIANVGTNFAYLDTHGKVRIAELDPALDYTTTGWVHRHIPLGVTVVGVTYNQTSDVLIVGTNTPVPRVPEAQSDADSETNGMSSESAKETHDLPRSTTYKGSIKLISPVTWTVTDSVDLPDDEAVVCLKSMSLEIAENTGRFKEYLAVGTSILLDENFVSNGNLILFAISEIVPEPGRPEVRHKVKPVHKELVRGAVTAMCEVMGRLVLAQGQRIMVRSIQENHAIEPIAFLDRDIYISELKAIRNLVVIGDLYDGTVLTSYANEPHNLYLTAQDNEKYQALSAEFISSEPRQDLYIAVTDNHGLLRINQFDPEMPQSLGGTRLMNQASFYTGRIVNTMTLIYGMGQDLAAIGGSGDGTLVAVYPADEVDYRTLFVVTQQMMDKEQPTACLNPRMHRNMDCEVSAQPVIDHAMCEKFWMLCRAKQLSYSRKLGRSGLDQVYEALQQEPFDYF